MPFFTDFLLIFYIHFQILTFIIYQTLYRTISLMALCFMGADHRYIMHPKDSKYRHLQNDIHHTIPSFPPNVPPAGNLSAFFQLHLL